MLNPNEKIDSWDVIVRTIDNTPGAPKSREFTCIDLQIELPYAATKQIDTVIENKYLCSWSVNCETCRKCGETTCGNDTEFLQCWEAIR